MFTSILMKFYKVKVEVYSSLSFEFHSYITIRGWFKGVKNGTLWFNLKTEKQIDMSRFCQKSKSSKKSLDFSLEDIT